MKKLELKLAMEERNLVHGGMTVKQLQSALAEWLKANSSVPSSQGSSLGFHCVTEIASPFAVSSAYDEENQLWTLYVSSPSTGNLLIKNAYEAL